MGEFERILKCSRTLAVSLQLLQTLSILMQNLKKEHAICKFYWFFCFCFWKREPKFSVYFYLLADLITVVQ